MDGGSSAHRLVRQWWRPVRACLAGRSHLDSFCGPFGSDRNARFGGGLASRGIAVGNAEWCVGGVAGGLRVCE
jgi:hypothetical protein